MNKSEAVWTLSKWLNEETNQPIDKTALAIILQHHKTPLPEYDILVAMREMGGVRTNDEDDHVEFARVIEELHEIGENSFDLDYTKDEVFRSIIAELKSNTYNLTKDECIHLIQEMRSK